MHMDIDTNMRLIGKRYPFYMKYKVTNITRYLHIKVHHVYATVISAVFRLDVQVLVF